MRQEERSVASLATVCLAQTVDSIKTWNKVASGSIELTLKLDHGLRRWYVDMYQSSDQSLTIDRSQLYLQGIQPEKNGRVGLRLEELMKGADFENVEARMMQLPLCAWPEDAREKEVGSANRENMSHLLSSLAIYPFTERLGMSISEVQVLLAQARREAQSPSLKAYFPVYVCIGQKKR
ncbi:hypothetical protein DHEL01_v201032 [Diaporthe helianthi]|uniref:Uncharacterized protein n=1 Tax=Diaporthe helianthi TaxID=158607 RepID=A0A2P5IDH9_DIAHE|nr:hypothetical protein DHEL01_v201032 [Diaporthe helianthi]